jgi:hypothetical protein
LPRQVFNEIGFRGTVSDRFWANVIPEPNSGCWLWLGSTDRKGYGQMRITTNKKQSKLKYATHISLKLHDHQIPSGLHVLHRCDNPACVNPEHLFVGTQQDNMRDMLQKGRGSAPPVSTKGRGLRQACKRGHILDGDNLYWRRDGSRSCRECYRIRKRQRRSLGFQD